MDSVRNYFKSNDYYYVNEANRLERKQLNFVQCFFRRFLGWYAETHLLNVVGKIYPLTLDARVQDLDPQTVLRLIDKANKVYGKAQAGTYIKLPSLVYQASLVYQGPKLPSLVDKGGNLSSLRYQGVMLPSLGHQGLKLSSIQTTVDVGVCYEVKPSDETLQLKISSVRFKLTFDPHTQSATSHEVSLFKHTAYRMGVHLPQQLLEDLQMMNVSLLHNHSKNTQANIINAFVANLLANGNWVDQICCPFNCNKSSQKEMGNLGWEYLGKETREEGGKSVSNDIFTLRKEKASEIMRKINWQQEPLSLTFASRELASPGVQDISYIFNVRKSNSSPAF